MIIVLTSYYLIKVPQTFLLHKIFFIEGSTRGTLLSQRLLGGFGEPDYKFSKRLCITRCHMPSAFSIQHPSPLQRPHHLDLQ